MVKELLKRSIRLVGESLKEYYLSRRVSESQFGNIKATEHLDDDYNPTITFIETPHAYFPNR
ncbi:hypothetical protein RhiirA5_411446 [Rhizophagus irregularis]|uniref:Uncharacterized protein n=1 Tax=Rhizophagus irregularis TaxID=588596 RepID=A0A2N1N5M3_9GLOM|nr:hypothetical protein RhiirA5_411446 [Rhizophagus irregularis]PKK69174.1 hypothetical protein RhiirC2_781329 [Rhizophagus irregularis]